MTTSIFLGTPEAAVPILDALAPLTDVAVVITRPDKPRGRSGRLIPPAIKVRAGELGIEVVQPSSGAELLDAVRDADPDVAVVAAYGRLIRPEVLAIPTHGFVNVHYSVLPRWRGASPVVRAILAGDAETGVSLMKMDEGLDTGPVIATARRPIGEADTTGTLTVALADLGADLLADVLPAYLAGRVEPEPQDDSLATAAGKVTVDEAHLDPLRHPVGAVDRAVRAFDPAPGAWCLLDDERFKVWRVAAWEGETVAPGAVVAGGDGVALGVADGAVRLVEVQPAGRPRMPAGAWMNGRRNEPAQLR